MSINKEDLNQELLALFGEKEFSEKALAVEDKNQEEYYKIVQSYIPGISYEKYVKDSEAIGEYYKSQGLVNESGLLELDQLDEVAGGGFVVIVLFVT